MFKLFSLSTISSVLIVAYLAFTVKKLYELMNPLDGVIVSGPTIDPLWPEHQEFSAIAFLSSTTKYKSFDISSLRANDQIIFEKHNIIHSLQAVDAKVDVRIGDSSRNSSHSMLKPDSENEMVVAASSKLWSQINNNKTSVYLHVVLMRHKASYAGITKFEDKISAGDLQNGDALTGYVCLIKHDKVPRRFRYRYLLSDFNLVNVSADDAARAAMPPDTVISYWKPEVAVKIVADFSKYPIEHVPPVMTRNLVYPAVSQQSNRDSSRRQQKQHQQLPFYKPAIHVDEIGLTSDKYVPLNSTVDSLTLQVSFGTMSLQRWLLMSTMEQSLKAQSGLGFSDRDMDDVRRLISDTSVYLLAVTFLASMLHLLFEVLAFQSDITFWQSNTSLAGLSTRALVTDLLSQIIVFLFLVQSDASLLITVPSFFGIGIQLWKVKKATGPSLVWTTYGIPRGIEFTRWKPVVYATTSAADVVMVESEKVLENLKDADIAHKHNNKHKTVVNSANATVGSATSNRNNDRCDSINSNDDNDKQMNSSDANTTSTEDVLDSSEEQLCRVTLEADRFATVYLSALLSPVVLVFVLRSLIYEKHMSWYGWVIGALTSCVYAFGFVLMCPQLYINHSLKSVSHLPWNFLVYKFLNTFIDDLFAFVIKMPTMHRLSVFRDDLVFIIYLYQRWIYRVDVNRPVEK